MQTQVLTNDMIRVRAPSAFAETAHDSRSARYAFIPTVSVIDAMRNEGFLPVYASQSRSRVPGKSDFTKHMLRFRREDQLDTRAKQIGDVSAEVVLVNSHDGTSAYNLYSGLFRLWCLNGAVTKIGDGDSFKIGHTGNIIDRVIEGSYSVMDGSRKALEHAKQWSTVTLADSEINVFSRAAALLRFDAETQPVSPARLIAPRRSVDTGSDLWSVWNRAQEGLIRGGQRYVSRNDETSRARRNTTRPVTGIDQNVKLNQALWTLGAEMAKLKGLELAA